MGLDVETLSNDDALLDQPSGTERIPKDANDDDDDDNLRQDDDNDEIEIEDPFPQRFVDGDDDEWKSYEIERLLKRRINRQGGRPTLEYMVRWKGYGAADDQWYPRELLMQNASGQQ
ncbi:hypothetical protein GQX73_g4615 [Xylaria multiplex]|uniref:Chromo domain-containing protein n=1 Tax=Xylaria multiplex TaxID=323545 RepID=A0A7C8ITW4_9PEZI|nr:hypothetical protein GQX73_g4615 [Xylaria multiplex]